jgi:hypothetical protein
MPDPHAYTRHVLVSADQPTSGAFLSRLLGLTHMKADVRPFGAYTLFQIKGQRPS